MQRLPALARALESFGFDEQSSVCVRVFEFGSTAFKDQSLQWQQWAVNAQENGGKNASFDDYDSWMRCRSAALSAWDKLALPMPCPPPLLFESLAESTPAPGNSLTKVCKSPFFSDATHTNILSFRPAPCPLASCSPRRSLRPRARTANL